MNFADIENVWRSAPNRPTAGQLEADRLKFVAELRRRNRGFAIFMTVVVGVLTLVTGRFALHALSGTGTPAVSATREWGALVMMALPWLAAGLFLWQHRRHRARYGAAAQRTIGESVRALLDENRLARRRLACVAGLHGVLLVVLPVVVFQLRAAGKAGDEILVPAFVVWPVIAAGILGGLLYHDRRTLRPRQRQLEEVLRAYNERGAN